MSPVTRIAIPTLVRVKDGALNRLGLYLRRAGRVRVAAVVSEGLPDAIVEPARASLDEHGIEAVSWSEARGASMEDAVALFADFPKSVSAVVGLGGGKALDVAKYAAFLARLPFLAVPTSLSNDGFCSPQSSLTLGGRRRSLPAALPHGVVVDTAVCRAAPRALTLSGVGDLVAKFTAIHDWKLAFHAVGEPVDDFAALLSDGAVHAYLARPRFDAEGFRLLATALMLNGVAMEICGSSRPASGSEHLVSHALDHLSARPRLHGLQVGVATHLIAHLQNAGHAPRVADLFEVTGFWDAVADDPFDPDEWRAALRAAPGVKADFHTVLDVRDPLPEFERLLEVDPRFAACFRRSPPLSNS